MYVIATVYVFMVAFAASTLLFVLLARSALSWALQTSLTDVTEVRIVTKDLICVIAFASIVVCTSSIRLV